MLCDQKSKTSKSVSLDNCHYSCDEIMTISSFIEVSTMSSLS